MTSFLNIRRERLAIYLLETTMTWSYSGCSVKVTSMLTSLYYFCKNRQLLGLSCVQWLLCKVAFILEYCRDSWASFQLGLTNFTYYCFFQLSSFHAKCWWIGNEAFFNHFNSATAVSCLLIPVSQACNERLSYFQRAFSPNEMLLMRLEFVVFFCCSLEKLWHFFEDRQSLKSSSVEGYSVVRRLLTCLIPFGLRAFLSRPSRVRGAATGWRCTLVSTTLLCSAWSFCRSTLSNNFENSFFFTFLNIRTLTEITIFFSDFVGVLWEIILRITLIRFVLILKVRRIQLM